MKPILLIYATREGQTRHITEHLGDVLAAHPMEYDIVDAARVPKGFSLARYSAAMVAASLHVGEYEPEMTTFVRCHLGELGRIPSTFISVSMAARVVEDEGAPPDTRPAAHENIRRTIDRFLAETGWRPTHIAEVGGTLMYSRYSVVTRFVLKLIAKHEGAPVDTTRDYEFTNWTKLDQAIDEQVRDNPSVKAAAQG